MISQPDKFAFPASFDPALAGNFRNSNERADAAMGWSYAAEHVGSYLGPYALFIRYIQSDLGKHQSEQASRYPNFHRDLPDSLIPPHLESDKQKDEFRKSFLSGLLPTRSRIGLYRNHSQSFDFHPNGHMALAGTAFNNLLFQGPAADMRIDPFWLQAGRYKEVVHDTGENTAPSILLKHGGVVGDISMHVGKSNEQRTLESTIQKGILDDEFSEFLSADMRSAIVALSAHDTESLPKDGVTIHDIGEVTHQDNSILTAFFAYKAAVRVLHGSDSPENIYLAGHYMALVDQANKKVPPKYTEVLAHNFRLQLLLGTHVADRLQRLDITTHKLDDHPDLLSWRMSDAVVEHYGEYAPKAA